MTSPLFARVTSALEAALEAAPDAEKQALAQALEDYAAQRDRTYRDMRSYSPMAGLLDAIIGATDAHL